MPSITNEQAQLQQSQQQPQQSQQQVLQQQHAMSAPAFPHLYTTSNIWNSAISNSTQRAKGSQDNDEMSSGSGALNANSEADVWGTTANPWKPENSNRSTSTSPNRTRDAGIAGITNGSIFDTAPAARAAANGYSTLGYPSRRSPPESTYRDSAGYSSARDSSLPPSRQSQGSPAFTEAYRGHGHTPSNSIQSQRPLPTHSSSFQNQSMNTRAFNYNSQQLEEDLSAQFSRRMTVDSNTSNAPAVSAASSFNPASQPFQLNPVASRFSDNVDRAVDSLASQYNVVQRGSVDHTAQGSNFGVEQRTSPRSYGSVEQWNARTDPRIAEQERRQQLAYQMYSGLYYQQQQIPAGYPLPNFSAGNQFAPNVVDLLGQPIRPFRMPQLSAGVSLPTNIQLPYANQDPGQNFRSALLEGFRTSGRSNKRYELKDIYGHIVEFSGDQHGSRFIQLKLESANSDEKDQVFREIESNATQLMKDVFGNYVIQKFFEHGNQIQKKVLAKQMQGKVVDLSVQVYACRVVQKALEHVLVEQQAELTKELEPEIVKVIRDQNGNHVVQKIIELVPRHHLDFIMAAIKGQVSTFSAHNYGCRVIQRMLEHGTQEDKSKIMEELHQSIQMLLTDQYGNYVAQHVIKYGKPEDRERIIKLVMEKLLSLSKHKFASNVVEKCIEHGSPQQRSEMRQQVSAVDSEGNSPLQQMIRDQYGNYVIQKLLEQLKGSEKKLLAEEIRPIHLELKKGPINRQIQALDRFFDELDGGKMADDGSTTSNPGLTNETNSPRSSDRPSTRSSIADADAGSASGKKTQSEGTVVYVRGVEA